MASLLNQLFGKGKDPFWQQAYTNLVRWIIELYRVLPHPQDGSASPGWVTLRDVYHCAIDKELFAAKIQEAQTFARDRADQWIVIDVAAIGDEDEMFALKALGFLLHPTRPDRLRAHPDPPVFDHLNDHTITYERERFENATAMEIRLRVEAVNRWYVHDWNTLDNKIRSSIVEGISVFLSMFDLPSVARVFCPAAPRAASAGDDPGDPINEDDAITATNRTGDLPPLDRLIESGKVLALNMPAGTNPALSRAVGVMLKNAWLQSLLRRPATMKAEPGRYVRPAVFICDEYQAFASVGEDDPSGDEKAFALTRQSVYSRLAGYEDLNDAVRVSADPTFRLIGSPKMWDRGAALTSTLHWFETELLTQETNLVGLRAVNRAVLAQAEMVTRADRIVLDMDSSESPVHGAQEGSAYNGHFASVCYHPLFLFTEHGDCVAATLRPGNVHSADDWDDLLVPEIERQQAEGKRVAFRADAAFAKPEIYDALEQRDVDYAIRMPGNKCLELEIEALSATSIRRSPASARTIRAATRKPLPSPGSAA